LPEAEPGEVLELEVGAPAQGGSCVARHEGRVVFVRHALPGERVRAVVTRDPGGRFCFADAVEVLTASPDRVDPPCPYAAPGRCGGCDWQHAAGPAQRELKAAVLRDQFTRLAGINVSDLLTGVEELPGGLLGWRTRIGYAVDAGGRLGLHRHRSAEIEPIDRCLLGIPGVGDSAVLTNRWSGFTGVELVAGAYEQVAVVGRRPGQGRQARGRRPPDRVEVLAGPPALTQYAAGRDFRLTVPAFWQVHTHSLDYFSSGLLAALEPRPGETVLDLYAGAGALTVYFADKVGATGRVLGVEADEQAVADAEVNLADLAQAEVRRCRVEPAVLGALDIRPDLVVLDPPRAGAGREVMAALLALGPRAIGYLSCDGGTLARDVAAAAESGWRLTGLRAFDAFPMTHHVECLATLEPESAVTSSA
jgi:tRNA/tmRNA/rRNA uracil-C5-methylase (TrmA/RlmC/RlmD family)